MDLYCWTRTKGGDVRRVAEKAGMGKMETPDAVSGSWNEPYDVMSYGSYINRPLPMCALPYETQPAKVPDTTTEYLLPYPPVSYWYLYGALGQPIPTPDGPDN